MKVHINPLDKLVSEYIRKRSGGYCERCGKYYGWRGLQACHFHGRRKQSVRFDEDNLVALDFGCHQYFHENPKEFEAFMKSRLGEYKFNLLQARSRPQKIDKELLTIYYKNKIEVENET